MLLRSNDFRMSWYFETLVVTLSPLRVLRIPTHVSVWRTVRKNTDFARGRKCSRAQDTARYPDFVRYCQVLLRGYRLVRQTRQEANAYCAIDLPLEVRRPSHLDYI